MTQLQLFSLEIIQVVYLKLLDEVDVDVDVDSSSSSKLARRGEFNEWNE